MKILLIALLLASCTVNAQDTVELSTNDRQDKALLGIVQLVDIVMQQNVEDNKQIKDLIDVGNENSRKINERIAEYDKKFVVMAKKIAELQLKIVELEGKTGAQTRW